MTRILTPILSILIALAIFFLFTQSIIADIRTTQSETKEYRDAVANAAKFNQKLNELVQRAHSFSAQDVERLETLTPKSVNEVKLLVDLEEMIRSHGMFLGNISVSESTEKEVRSDTKPGITYEEDFIPSDVSFTLIGTYDQFRGLLADIERSLVLMDVTHLKFSAKEGALQQYEVTIRTYALTSGSQ